MITEAIILAGGKGTRLSTVIQDLPKPMAPINGLPFLTYLFDDLQRQGIQTIYLAVGYLREKIISYYGNWYKNVRLEYVIEETPLGTGGAIKKALSFVSSRYPVVINGDTFFSVDLPNFYAFHLSKASSLTLALKNKENADRYGTVKINNHGKVEAFVEKTTGSSGWINGGTYLIDMDHLKLSSLPESFSFETEVLEKEYQNGNVYGFASDGYFIDIGIPSDYEIAQSDLTTGKVITPIPVDQSWTLFLDRDGVINQRKVDDYVKSVEEFQFLPGVIDAIANFSNIFDHIFVVTNQQCIGKKIITEAQLNEIHSTMLKEIELHGGRISKVYFAPQLASEESNFRKPGSGMAELAKEEFPSIDFSKSIMVGDANSDMEFGRRKGMITIGIGLNKSPMIDLHLSSLQELGDLLNPAD